MGEMKTKCINQLKELTSKKEIFFTDRGNTSILLALKLAKSLGKTKAFIQDQGGWITYGQYIRKLKFEMHALETDSGIVRLESLRGLDDTSVLLINSMPGYHALQENMGELSKLCKEKGCFLINDASGSIGRKEAKYGDIVLGSFGEWKPVEVKYGGFIGFDNSAFAAFFEENMKKEVKDFYHELYKKLTELPGKIKESDKESDSVKFDLSGHDIIHKTSKGYNIIVKIKSESERLRLLDYCKLKGYEFTFCPRYIRVLDDAVSIELKRKN